MNKLTQKRLKELLKYDKKSGIFTRKTGRGGKKANDIAGSLHKTGYIIINVDEKSYQAHRLAWLYVYGEMPKEQIDHINHIKTDNAIKNLRMATQKENSKNMSKSKKNTSGVTGVHWHNVAKRWCARINVDGKKIHLGLFAQFSDAVNARKNAEILHGYHENHGV